MSGVIATRPPDYALPGRVSPPRGPWLMGGKRVADLMAALLLAVPLLPLLALAAVAIRLDSPGPALFRQWRVGCGGRPFVIYKLRTMRTDVSGPALTMTGDPRITRLGRLLRRTSIDELPQVLNILKGDMSFIGPRPEVPSVLEAEWTEEQRDVLAVRPGLSGWAQIHGRDDLPLETKLAYDLEYVRDPGLLRDLRILLATPGLLISGRGIK
ncbi:MAG: sugar transferase [Candidatus Sericytochromatia bacterium]|nr:sugar transferase [Candidatus Sericytochromatia bacterium]